LLSRQPIGQRVPLPAPLLQKVSRTSAAAHATSCRGSSTEIRIARESARVVDTAHLHAGDDAGSSDVASMRAASLQSGSCPRLYARMREGRSIERNGRPRRHERRFSVCREPWASSALVGRV
jgi:hypothetical protein